MTYWLAQFQESVTTAAREAGLKRRREQGPGFDGDEWVWQWREYLGDDAVAADVRLSVSLNESSQRIHADVWGLAWPVDPTLRHLSTSASRSSKELALDLFLAGDRPARAQFEGWLANRLSQASAAAQDAARSLLQVRERQDAAERLQVRLGATSGVGYSVEEEQSLGRQVEQLKATVSALQAEMESLVATRAISVQNTGEFDLVTSGGESHPPHVPSPPASAPPPDTSTSPGEREKFAKAPVPSRSRPLS